MQQRDTIDLTTSVLHNLHSSYTEKPHSFQLIADSVKSDSFDPSNDVIRKPSRTSYIFSAQSQEAKESWMHSLRRLIPCCARCSLMIGRSGSFVNGHFELSKDAPPLEEGEDMASFRHDKYLQLHGLKLIVYEAKGLNVLPGVKSLAPYCVVCLDDVRLAKTAVLTGETPFWADEFVLRNLSMHHQRLRIILYHYQKGEEDLDIGYVSINYMKLSPGQAQEEWYPVNVFLRPGMSAPEGRSCSLRLSVERTVTPLSPLGE